MRVLIQREMQEGHRGGRRKLSLRVIKGESVRLLQFKVAWELSHDRGLCRETMNEM